MNLTKIDLVKTDFVKTDLAKTDLAKTDLAKTVYDVVVFDLDDTLIRISKNGFHVPKQTWHKLNFLKKNNIRMAIISYNSLAPMWIKCCGLENYIEMIDFGDINRSELMSNVLKKMNISSSKILYFDDRMDNILEIKKVYNDAVCVHVDNPKNLHKLIKDQFK